MMAATATATSVLDAVRAALDRASAAAEGASDADAAPTASLRVDVVVRPAETTEDDDGTDCLCVEIWIAQAAVAGEGAAPVLVFGLRALEYGPAAAWPANRGRVYLQYVDSTDHFQPRWARSLVTRAVTRAYLASVGARGAGAVVHVFARHRPHFLFPGSTQATRPFDATRAPTEVGAVVEGCVGRGLAWAHPAVRGRAGRGAYVRQLVRWWAKTLADVPVQSGRYRLFNVSSAAQKEYAYAASASAGPGSSDMA